MKRLPAVTAPQLRCLIDARSGGLRLDCNLDWRGKRGSHSKVVVRNLRKKGLFLFAPKPDGGCGSEIKVLADILIGDTRLHLTDLAWRLIREQGGRSR